MVEKNGESTPRTAAIGLPQNCRKIGWNPTSDDFPVGFQLKPKPSPKNGDWSF